MSLQEPDWLPEDTPAADPSSSSPSLRGEEGETPIDVGSLRWSPEFWDEPEDAGLQLVRGGLLIAGQINEVNGLFEQGKTWVAIDQARQWIESGRPVLYLDFEMGRRRVRKRLKANGWTAEHLPLFHYAYSPGLPPGKLALVAAALPESLVVIDSLSAALMSLGLDENSATEVGGWWERELRGACEQAGATFALVSQVKQSASSSMRFTTRGTGATSFGADVKWFVERYEKFSPDQVGKIKLTLQKDREGVLPDRLGFIVGDGQGNVTLEPCDPPKGEPLNPDLLEKVIDVFEGIDAELHGGWVVTNTIKEATEGYGWGSVNSALEYHREAGVLEARINPDRKNSTQWRRVPEDERAAQAPINTPALD